MDSRTAPQPMVTAIDAGSRKKSRLSRESTAWVSRPRDLGLRTISTSRPTTVAMIRGSQPIVERATVVFSHRSHPIVVATAIVAALHSSLCAQSADVGSTAPPLEVTDAVNSTAIAPDALTNQARVYFFVRLQEDSSLFLLETLDKLADELAFDTIHFYAVTGDKKEMVEKTLSKDDVKSPVLVTANENSFQAFGIPIFPCVIVIDGSNKIRFRGTPGTFNEIRDAAIDVSLSSVLAPDLPASAKAIGKSFERWQLGEAWKALDKELAKPKLAAADKVKLEHAKSRITALAGKLARAAARFEKTEDWPRCIIALWRLDKEFAGIPGAEVGKTKLDALKQRAVAEPAFLAEFNGGVECAKAERFERDRDWKKAHSSYTSIAKSNSASKAGKYAASKAELLKLRAGVK